jgi:hypothetical protein
MGTGTFRWVNLGDEHPLSSSAGVRVEQ